MKRSKEERERLIAQAKLRYLNGWNANEISREIGVPEMTVRYWIGEVSNFKTLYKSPVCIHTDPVSTEVKNERIADYQELVKQSLPLMPREYRERLECAS